MKTNHNIEFGKRVNNLRKSMHLSQEQFALKCDIDRSYMGCIERGEKSPTLTTIQKIADGLGVSLKELFNY